MGGLKRWFQRGGPERGSHRKQLTLRLTPSKAQHAPWPAMSSAKKMGQGADTVGEKVDYIMGGKKYIST